MSEQKEFDLSIYLQDGQVCLENLRIENCKIVGLQCKAGYFKGCVFEHVVFDYQFEQRIIIFEECEFTKSEFHGNLKKTQMVLRDNLFKGCLFENIFLEFMEGGRSVITDNGFFDCVFKNVKSEQELQFTNQMICGGKMEEFSLLLDVTQALCSQQCSNMQHNIFSNMQMENVHFMAAYNDNVMESVSFWNTAIEWILELDNANSQDNNKFYECDTSGLTCCKIEY